MPEERIIPLDLIVGNFEAVSLGQINEDLERAENTEHFLALGLIASIGYAPHLLSGETGPRTVMVNSAMGPIGLEMNQRGLDPRKVNLDACFQGRCAQAAEGAVCRVEGSGAGDVGERCRFPHVA